MPQHSTFTFGFEIISRNERKTTNNITAVVPGMKKRKKQKRRGKRE